MKDLMSYIEDQLDENGELPSFDPSSIPPERWDTLQENVANSLRSIFDGSAKGEEREMVLEMNGEKHIVKYIAYNLSGRV